MLLPDYTGGRGCRQVSSLYNALHTRAALPLLLVALALLFGQTKLFLLSLREKRSRKQTVAAAVHLMEGILLFVVLLECYDIVYYPYPRITRHSVPLSGFFSSIPWWIYVFYEALSAAVLTLHLREYRRYRMTTVTPDAIRQSVDLLPEGICVSAPEGTALLVNLKMDALCCVLTGEHLLDAGRLWAWLEQNGEDQEGKRLARTPQGEAWLFERDELSVEGREYRRMSAVNVTGCYRITEELREKNARLQEIQRRMKEAVELSGEMFIKQEEASARSALHNELGQVLLMGRHYIEHPDSTDAAVVALMTKQMNDLLLGESKPLEPPAEDELRQAVRLAGGIGVTVALHGEAPQAGKARSLLAQAIRECAANTVKHAEGDRLCVEIACRPEGSADGAEPGELVITVTNNGKPPNGPVAESGGLLSLRRSVEAAGGWMTVESQPRFSLTITLTERR